jgi:HSP20 family protein
MTMLRIFQPSRNYAPAIHPHLWNNLLTNLFESDSRLDQPSYSIPRANILEEDHEYVVELFIPGVSKEEIKIELNNDLLIVSAETKKEQEVKYQTREFNYDTFKRSFTLPEDVKVDDITAEYLNGILKIALPKVAKAPQLKKEIEIR